MKQGNNGTVACLNSVTFQTQKPSETMVKRPQNDKFCFPFTFLNLGFGKDQYIVGMIRKRLRCKYIHTHTYIYTCIHTHTYIVQQYLIINVSQYVSTFPNCFILIPPFLLRAYPAYIIYV